MHDVKSVDVYMKYSFKVRFCVVPEISGTSPDEGEST